MHKKTTVRPVSFKHWPALLLENELTSMVLIPEIGGKVVSIKSLATECEFLWQDDTRPYATPHYGELFANYDASGFDECFPSIGQCAYPEFPWQGITIPDHGEIWCGADGVGGVADLGGERGGGGGCQRRGDQHRGDRAQQQQPWPSPGGPTRDFLYEILST